MNSEFSEKMKAKTSNVPENESRSESIFQNLHSRIDHLSCYDSDEQDLKLNSKSNLK